MESTNSITGDSTHKRKRSETGTHKANIEVVVIFGHGEECDGHEVYVIPRESLTDDDLDDLQHFHDTTDSICKLDGDWQKPPLPVDCGGVPVSITGKILETYHDCERHKRSDMLDEGEIPVRMFVVNLRY